MAEQVRVDFLNWRPDAEDVFNQGLVVATNAIHDTEGWKPVHVKTTTSFSTTGGLEASAATVTSLVAKPIGTGTDLMCAWISNNTVQIGVNGVTMTSAGSVGGGLTGYPLAFATAGTDQQISFFDVCENEGFVFFVVEAWQRQASPLTSVALRHIGYAAI